MRSRGTLHQGRPQPGARHAPRRLYRDGRAAAAGAFRHRLRHAPRRHGRPRHVDRRGRQREVLLHSVQDATRQQHGRVSHSGALRPVRQQSLPGEGAVREPAEDVHADVFERADVPGQDDVPRGVHERRGPEEPGGRVPGRGAPPRHLPSAAHLRAGGLAPGASGRGRKRGRAHGPGRAPCVQRRRLQRDEGRPERPGRGAV